MSTKRQQTMAKIARERSVKERRARKLERKRERKLAASEAADQTVVEAPPGEGAEETPLVPTVD
jgi:hypothetical protein